MSTTTESQDLARLRAVQALYDQEIAPCPRSPEWKLGARAGMQRAHGLRPMPSPWAAGTCQDDARTAGFHVGHALAQEQLKQKGRP